MFLLTAEPIDTAKLVGMISQTSIGAVVTFEGRVRDHNLGRNVSFLEYEVYGELATREGLAIMEEVRRDFPIANAFAVHRYGKLKLSEVAVTVVVAASHRDEAFKAARYVIDEIKHRLPIWKQEHYTSGQKAWVGCAGCEKRTSDKLNHAPDVEVAWIANS